MADKLKLRWTKKYKPSLWTAQVLNLNFKDTELALAGKANRARLRGR